MVSTVPAQVGTAPPAGTPQDDFLRSFTRARALVRERRFLDAVREFQNAIRLKDGRCYECSHQIGLVYFQLGRFDEAADALRQALTLNPPNEGEIQELLGQSLYQQNDKRLLSDAATAFRRAIEVSAGKAVRSHLFLGYTLIKLGKVDEGRKSLRTYLELEPASDDGGQARAVLVNPQLVFEPLAPAFRVIGLKGEALSLERFRGRIVLLDFWATWCGPCTRELPARKELWNRFSNDDFVILGISLDDDYLTLQDFLRNEGIKWPQYFDDSGRISQLYRVRAIPYSVLIDHDGVIRGQSLHGRDLATRVEELLKRVPKRERSIQ